MNSRSVLSPTGKDWFARRTPSWFLQSAESSLEWRGRASIFLIPALLAAGIWGHAEEPALLGLFSPLSNIVCVYGVLVTFKAVNAMLVDNTPFSRWWVAAIVVAHATPPLLFWQQPKSPGGAGVAAAVLLAVLAIYWLLDTWPYSLSPLNSVAFCFALVFVELV